jgi:opacity protein-like surface antigen
MRASAQMPGAADITLATDLHLTHLKGTPPMTLLPNSRASQARKINGSCALRKPAFAALLLLAGGLTLGASAQAQNSASNSKDLSLNGSALTYISLNAGTADLSRPITAFGVFGGEHQGTAYSISYGNYFQTQNLGYEIGYTDFGSASYKGATTKVDGINISLIGRMPLAYQFNLLGKVGTTYGRTDVSSNGVATVNTGSERAFAWSYGIGGEWLVSASWSAVLAYDEHYVRYPVDGNERVSLTTLGVRYRY